MYRNPSTMLQKSQNLAPILKLLYKKANVCYKYIRRKRINPTWRKK